MSQRSWLNIAFLRECLGGTGSDSTVHQPVQSSVPMWLRSRLSFVEDIDDGLKATVTIIVDASGETTDSTTDQFSKMPRFLRRNRSLVPMP